MPGTPTNPYYTRVNDYDPVSLARGSEQVGEADAVQAGFDIVDVDITKLEGDIANLELGSPPGFPAAIDTRWYVTDTSGGSTSVYTGVLSPPATGVESIPDGYSIDFVPTASNIAGPTLNVNTADGAVAIFKRYLGLNVPLEIGDMEAGVPAKLTFQGGVWLLREGGSSSGGGAGVVPVGTIFPFAGATAPTGYLPCDGATVSQITYADLYAVIGATYGTGGAGTFKVPDLRGRLPAGMDDMGTGEGDAGRIGVSAVLGASAGADTHTLTSSQMPVHNHSGSTASSGSHSHSTNTAGGHSHTGTALLSGSHSHTLDETKFEFYDSNGSALGPANGTIPVSNSTYEKKTNVLKSTAGAVSTYPSHTHNLSLDFYAAHSHTTDTTGSHTHTVTINNAGSGSAHNNLQPTLFMNYVIRY